MGEDYPDRHCSLQGHGSPVAAGMPITNKKSSGTDSDHDGTAVPGDTQRKEEIMAKLRNTGFGRAENGPRTAGTVRRRSLRTYVGVVITLGMIVGFLAPTCAYAVGNGTVGTAQYDDESVSEVSIQQGGGECRGNAPRLRPHRRYERCERRNQHERHKQWRHQGRRRKRYARRRQIRGERRNRR